MDFLFVNTQELTALMDLPLIQRVAYLMGIRPYMDKQTCIVGIKRKISYQSLREVLYIAPIAGVKTECPSHQQVRRAIKSLERAGLVKIQSTDKNLILKCILAAEDRSVQNKADMRPTPQADTRKIHDQSIKSTIHTKIHCQANRDAKAQADTPHNSEVNYVFLCQQFEKFCSLYPIKKSEQKAWEVFQQMNPSEMLCAHILTSLQNQITNIEQQQERGLWVPNWKNPANWLAGQCWKDELTKDIPQEKRNATHKPNHSKPADPFWDSCMSGAESETDNSNVIQFSKWGN